MITPEMVLNGLHPFLALLGNMDAEFLDWVANKGGKVCRARTVVLAWLSVQPAQPPMRLSTHLQNHILASLAAKELT